jgi:RNA polymerase sigma-70 factor, ECF subfamily
MSTQDDNRLVECVRNGDTEAFGMIVERHKNRLYYLGLKFFHNQEDAEDFLQEVFLKAYEKLSSFRGVVPFGAWLYKLAFNLAVNRYHVNKAALLKEAESIPDIAEEPVAASLDWERIETVAEVNDAIRELPALYSLIIRMHFFDGFTYNEVSEIMDIPVNTVKSHIFRAKKLIVRLLNERNRSG